MLMKKLVFIHIRHPKKEVKINIMRFYENLMFVLKLKLRQNNGTQLLCCSVNSNIVKTNQFCTDYFDFLEEFNTESIYD